MRPDIEAIKARYDRFQEVLPCDYDDANEQIHVNVCRSCQAANDFWEHVDEDNGVLLDYVAELEEELQLARYFVTFVSQCQRAISKMTPVMEKEGGE